LFSFLFVFVFFFGQLARINTPFFSRSLPLLDLGILVLSVLNLYFLKTEKGEMNFPLLFFVVYTFLRSILTQPDLLSLAYLFRLSFLLLLLALRSKKLEKNQPQVRSFLLLIILANAVFGLFQYFLWPDFTFFSAQDWDPHLYRLISTFFDPTFTALIYLLGMQILYHRQDLPPALKTFLYFLLFLATSLTYSRAAIIVFLYLVYLNNKKLLHLGLLLVIFTILLLPRPFGEGTKLERTSTLQARLENYKQAVNLSLQKPLFGIGYNQLPLFKDKNRLTSHSSSGFDSSLLTILSTTGLLGLSLFLLGLKTHLQTTNPLNKNLTLLVLLHSFSANSLLYLWILFILVLV
jgi:hypothetical protein